DVLAPVAQQRPHLLLGAALVAVDVGRIEEGDAEIERLVDDAPRPFEVEPDAEIVAAEPDRRDAEAGGAEIAQFHRETPFERRMPRTRTAGRGDLWGAGRAGPPRVRRSRS